MASRVIFSQQEPCKAEIRLPWSKSLVNRLLLIHRIADLPLETLEPYCDCRDSRELYKALQQNTTHILVGEGAAPYRFCMALMAAFNKQVILEARGSMLHRDISPLVDALNAAGARIKYLGEPGKPPVLIEQGLHDFHGFVIDTEKSSQFASALMLVAPLFPGEKRIQTTGQSVSIPYLNMSAGLMAEYGVRVAQNLPESEIRIAAGSYKQPRQFPVETDWSAAAFFFTLVAIKPGSGIHLEGLHQHSLQGDSILPELFKPLGVETRWTQHGLDLFAVEPSTPLPAELNFSAFPDLLPAYLVACAARKQRISISGIGHLALKESNRTETLAQNFRTLGVDFFPEPDYWVFDASGFHIPDGLLIETAKDHRMAMAFAMLGLLKPLAMDDVDCVSKSFPGFWDALKKCNLNLE